MITFVNDDTDSDDDEEEGDSEVMKTAMMRHDYNNGRNNNDKDMQIMFTRFNFVPSVFHLPSPKGVRVMKISWEQGYSMTAWFTELVV